ncbi:MAG: biotin/lipoyl-binding protein, partial [Verrucomicrobia bacterium]|nr:biotin/lipoyl-binding protein [Verrucomicrobiota bacterium]
MNFDFKLLLQSGRRGLKYLLPLIAAAIAIGYFALRPIPVTRHLVAAGTVQAEVMGTGTLAARVKVVLSPKIQGRLMEVLADQNDRVNGGQLLARLD